MVDWFVVVVVVGAAAANPERDDVNVVGGHGSGLSRRFETRQQARPAGQGAAFMVELRERIGGGRRMAAVAVAARFEARDLQKRVLDGFVRHWLQFPGSLVQLLGVCGCGIGGEVMRLEAGARSGLASRGGERRRDARCLSAAYWAQAHGPPS